MVPAEKATGAGRTEAETLWGYITFQWDGAGLGSGLCVQGEHSGMWLRGGLGSRPRGSRAVPPNAVHPGTGHLISLGLIFLPSTWDDSTYGDCGGMGRSMCAGTKPRGEQLPATALLLLHSPPFQARKRRARKAESNQSGTVSLPRVPV